MAQAFIIMQIGNPDLDSMCESVIVPALQACGLDPRRVDKHNEGSLLKSEIVRFIQQSEIIVADLTNERPNCYLEVGYAMGIDKFRNLILTARADHNADATNHLPGGPKVHFDLAGYELLFWDPRKLDEARAELTKRIRRRLAVINGASTAASPWDAEWIQNQRAVALPQLGGPGFPGGLEVRHAPADRSQAFRHTQLLDAARQAQIHTFGWPIGVVLETPEFAPRPRADAVFEEILIRDRPISTREKTSYDYWALRRNGDYYLAKNYMEDERYPSVDDRRLFFNTRIVRVTEVLLHCARLYGLLGLDPTSVVHIAIRHTGLQGRRLHASTSNRHLLHNPVCTEEESESVISPTLSEIEANLTTLVKRIVHPLFILFEFFELSDKVLDDIVNDFVNGKVT